MNEKWDVFGEVGSVLTEMAKGRGRGHWGHKGRKGKRGGSLPSKGVGTAAARADKKITGVVANALIASSFTPKDAKNLEYRALKKSVTIRDKGGYFGHTRATLTQSDLDWKGLTVGQVADFLDRHGASKFKATRRKRRHYVHYD